VLAVCPLPNALSRDLGPDALLADGLEEETLVARFRQLPEGAVVLVDDAELLKEGPLAQALLAMVQQARGKRWRVLVAGATAEVGAGYSGWVYEARKSRQGLLLSPQGMADGDIFSVRLMRSSLMPRVHPGRGLTIDPGGSQTLVQVPLVD
jgi:S-DNA-T family DNA segregation ATPase FtsK/SpoIIIE